MTTTKKHTGRAMTFPAGVLMGALAALVWSVGCAALLAMLIDKEMLAYESIGYGAMLILFTASALASLIAWKNIKHRKVAVCLSAGAAYFGILLAITGLFFGGQYHGVGVTGAVILAGTGIVLLSGFGKSGTGSRGTRKKRR